MKGFLDKNKDLLFRDLSQAMFACDNPLLKKFFPEGKQIDINRKYFIQTAKFQFFVHGQMVSLQEIQKMRLRNDHQQQDFSSEHPSVS